MTFGEMKDLIANRLGDTSTNTKTRIGEFINDIMFRISDEVQYPGEVRWGQIRTESGRYSYPLDPDVGSVIEPMIVPEENANIWRTPNQTFNANVHKPTSTGTPHNFMEMGNYGVERQPASALRFIAQDDLDEEVTVTIQGMVDFRNVSETVTLPSGADDPVDSVNSYTTLDKISLSASASHNIDIKADGPALNEVEVSCLLVGETDAVTSAYGLFNPASRVSIVSSSASDRTEGSAGARTVTFTGYGPLMGTGSVVLEDNVYREVSLRSNGTTPEVSTDQQRFTTIESVSVDAEAEGVITVKVDPIDARKAVYIPQKKRSVDIPIVAFYPITNGQIISYQYYRTLTPLTIDSSRPAMDKRVHYYIRKWAETAVNSWYGDSSGVSETIQNAIPSWQKDMQSIRNILGLSANPEVVIGGRARNISRKYGPSAMLDPAHYSN